MNRRLPHLDKSNLLLLGASGFVGRSVLAHIHKMEDSALLFDKLYTLSRNHHNFGARITPLLGDLSREPISCPNVEIIIHAATPASAELNHSDPNAMFNLNVDAMAAVIDFAAQQEEPPTVLFTSSGAVYAPDSHTAHIGTDAPVLNPTDFSSSAYARGKIEAELMLQDATLNGKCKGIVARLFAFSGTHLPRDRHFAIGNFVENAVALKKITIRSDGLSLRSYLDERDMAHWLLSIIDKGVSDHIYHVGSEREISIRELAFLVSERYNSLTGELIPVEILGQKSPIDGVSRYVPSTFETRKELGLSETISLESSIDSMLHAALAAQL
jgi:nucleoside-diphosphate-sugar epimerase